MDIDVIEFGKYNEENNDLPERHGHKKGRKRRGKKVLLKLAGIIIIAVVILLSPIFSIKNITVTDMEAYTQSEICEIGGISAGENVFVTALTAAKKLESNPYFKTVSVKIGLPSSITVNIEERKVRGYISYMGSYLYIDEYGLVLDSKNNFKTRLPVFTGLEFSKFKVGEKLPVDNDKAFETVVEMTQILTKYDALEDVDSVDVKDVNNILIVCGSVQVKIGTTRELDQKIRIMHEILKQLTEDDRGTLDLTDLSKPLIFKYLT